MLSLEVEQLALRAEFDTAMGLVETLVTSSRKISERDRQSLQRYLRKVILTNQVFSLCKNDEEAPEENRKDRIDPMLLKELEQLYRQVLEDYPECMELRAEFAYLLFHIFGKREESLSFLKDSLSIARSKQEMLELHMVYIIFLQLHLC